MLLLQDVYLVVLVIVLQQCGVIAVVPSYLPPLNGLSRLQLILAYFDKGFSYNEILIFLFVYHGFTLCRRQLMRILQKHNRRRRLEHSSDEQVVRHMIGEMEYSGQCIGYRALWQRLVLDHRLRVPRDKVLRIMRLADPDGIALRKAHRLKRRKYYARGPNYIWHADGYDKLKPFGFGIHGAIDGYSRKILWLEVSSSNKNPSLIAKYYLDALDQFGVAPRVLRCDLGTENCTLALLQPFFRYRAADPLSGLNSFMYGKSVSNQRIESWWGTMRRQGLHWWISLFKDLRDTGVFQDTNHLHVECVRFCFMDLIQSDLDRIAQNWNLHAIRMQKNADIPDGKPDILYLLPELNGHLDYGTPVDQDDVTACKEMYSSNKQTCSNEFLELLSLIKPDAQPGTNFEESMDLFIELKALLETL